MTTKMDTDEWKPAAYGNYKWIVRDPELLGGKLAVRALGSPPRSCSLVSQRE